MCVWGGGLRMTATDQGVPGRAVGDVSLSRHSTCSFCHPVPCWRPKKKTYPDTSTMGGRRVVFVEGGQWSESVCGETGEEGG